MQKWSLLQWSLYSTREDIYESVNYLICDLTTLVICATKERST